MTASEKLERLYRQVTEECDLAIWEGRMVDLAETMVETLPELIAVVKAAEKPDSNGRMRVDLIGPLIALERKLEGKELKTAAELSSEMLAVICRQVFRMRDAKETLEDTAEALGLTAYEVLDILDEAEERGLIER